MRNMSRWLENHVVNPQVRAAVARGIARRTYAVLETTGRRTGRPRCTPIANGLQGDVFWLISAHGRHAHYVRNLTAHPRVRIAVHDGERLRWRTGTARLLPEDDTRMRQRELGRGRLGYRLDAALMRALATDLRTIRIDLDAC
jgi:deazaflavin-dependent oxidoreductase (nitroreductase family)